MAQDKNITVAGMVLPYDHVWMQPKATEPKPHRVSNKRSLRARNGAVPHATTKPRANRGG